MLLFLVYSSYCFSSEHFDTSTQYGTTNNAAQFGLNWVMTNVLPQQAGLQVSNVVYRYTTVKDPSDDMIVHVQNENARGPGYIFRASDDWSGVPGSSINKAVPIDFIDISYWGPGSIEVEGTGSVTDAEVFYTYKYDPCFDPQSNPNCPGYVDPFALEILEISATDPLDDDYVQDELDRKANMKAQEDEEKEKQRAKLKEAAEEVDERLEQLLGVIIENELSASQQLIHDQLSTLMSLPASYQTQLRGGNLPDGVMPPGGKLPSNTRGLRQSFASELRHAEMVRLQYGK